MDLNYHYQNFIDNREHHYEYYLLMEEYSHTPLFKQMIVFMNTTFPEWKTHNGVGSNIACKNTKYNIAFSSRLH